MAEEIINNIVLSEVNILHTIETAGHVCILLLISIGFKGKAASLKFHAVLVDRRTLIQWDYASQGQPTLTSFAEWVKNRYAGR